MILLCRLILSFGHVMLTIDLIVPPGVIDETKRTEVFDRSVQFLKGFYDRHSER